MQTHKINKLINNFKKRNPLRQKDINFKTSLCRRTGISQGKTLRRRHTARRLSLHSVYHVDSNESLWTEGSSKP